MKRVRLLISSNWWVRCYADRHNPAACFPTDQLVVSPLKSVSPTELSVICPALLEQLSLLKNLVEAVLDIIHRRTRLVPKFLHSSLVVGKATSSSDVFDETIVCLRET